MDLLKQLRTEVERAEAHHAATSNADKATALAYSRGRQIEALRLAVDKVEDASEKIEAENALSVLWVRLGAQRPPTFDRTEGDALIDAANSLSKIAGMIDSDVLGALSKRWVEATASVRKVDGGKGTGTRTNRDKVDYVLRFKSTDGTEKRNRPAASADLSKQVNEARYQFGFKADAKALSDAIRSVLSGESGEVEVPEVGKVWRESLAG